MTLNDEMAAVLRHLLRKEAAPCGRPAAEVLRAEIDFLGEVLGRDLFAESGRREA